MLKIRSGQMRQLDAFAVEGFVDRLVRHLEGQHPEAIEGLTSEEVRHDAELAVAEGRDYGLRSEAVLTAFVALCFVIAPGFHRQRSINRLLRRMRFDADQNLDRLVAKTSPADWEEAARMGSWEVLGGTESESRQAP